MTFSQSMMEVAWRFLVIIAFLVAVIGMVLPFVWATSDVAGEKGPKKRILATILGVVLFFLFTSTCHYISHQKIDPTASPENFNRWYNSK